MRKTALLTGVAGLFLLTAPAFAQDSTAPQTPPADPAAEQAADQPAAQPQQLTLQPGSVVRSADGAELGRLEGVRSGPGGQELTVRGSDGQLRGVPTTGIRQEGDAIVVDFGSGQFQSAPAITDTAPPAGESTMPPASPDTTAPTQPAQPDAGEGNEPTDPAAAPLAEEMPAEPATDAPDSDQDEDPPADGEPGA